MYGIKIFWVVVLFFFVQSFSQSDTLPIGRGKGKYLSLSKCRNARDSMNHYKAEAKVNMAIVAMKLDKIDSALNDSTILPQKDSLKINE
jgi:hypothetical protein